MSAADLAPHERAVLDQIAVDEIQKLIVGSTPEEIAGARDRLVEILEGTGRPSADLAPRAHHAAWVRYVDEREAAGAPSYDSSWAAQRTLAAEPAGADVADDWSMV